MDQTERTFLQAGVLNAALYIAMVLAAALAWHDRMGAGYAIASAAATTLSYAIWLTPARRWSIVPGLLSWGLGIAAGVCIISQALS